ncbi:eukaryotic translation initiation factor 1-like [Gigantopelta aegis]|uniref:eukaryotic translation initiation factor 1-like n=1 Tax=Gigantopelta aegis TaxID=1735272 RepID=UPI001B88D1B5|nr:eukaryotic translation initiation factor 1-like [Gigantopelta aegis]
MSSDIQNLTAGLAARNQVTDPFADSEDSDVTSGSSIQDPVHIRIQQRNGRKMLTTVQGINPKYDFRKIVKHAKKEFACNGTVVEHPEYGEVIQLQGDQRQLISNFLITTGIVNKEQVKVHGF